MWAPSPIKKLKLVLPNAPKLCYTIRMGIVYDNLTPLAPPPDGAKVPVVPVVPAVPSPVVSDASSVVTDPVSYGRVRVSTQSTSPSPMTVTSVNGQRGDVVVHVPERTSELVNDGQDGTRPYLTRHQSLEHLATKQELASKADQAALDSAVASLSAADESLSDRLDAVEETLPEKADLDSSGTVPVSQLPSEATRVPTATEVLQAQADANGGLDAARPEVTVDVPGRGTSLRLRNAASDTVVVLDTSESGTLATREWTSAAFSRVAHTPRWPFHVVSASSPSLWVRTTSFPVVYRTSDWPEDLQIPGGRFCVLGTSGGLVTLADAEDPLRVLASFDSGSGELVSLGDGVVSLSFRDGVVSLVPLDDVPVVPYCVNLWTPSRGGRVSFELGPEVGSNERVDAYAAGVDLRRGALYSREGLLFHCRSDVPAALNLSWASVSPHMDYMARELLLVADCRERTDRVLVDWPAEVRWWDGPGAPTAPRPESVNVYRCTETMPGLWTVHLVSSPGQEELEAEEPGASTPQGSGARLSSVRPQATSSDGSVSEASGHSMMLDYAKAVVDDSEGWSSDPTYVPAKGEIVVYSDGGGEGVPAVKIGTGNAAVGDLAFLGADLSARIIAAVQTCSADLARHAADDDLHLREGEREYWNDKVTVDSSVDGEVLVVTKDNLLAGGLT